MMLVVFRSRLRNENDSEYQALAPRILELAQSMPGFVSFKSFRADDGERVSARILGWIEIADCATRAAWSRPKPRLAEGSR
jgi:antibiotic biosynthesis monooxygenase (ABM) superfamily enzyme